MKQIGQEPFTVLPYKLAKESNESSVWYFYQDDIIQIKIILEGIPKPSVTIKTKQDAFTGAVGSSSLYYSLLN
ncbi:MAG: hypothetical protein KGZ87_08760 [Bacteroidetes bacterium]|nr:hypothetical protein [Bacteroidota bacterium]